MHTTMIHDPKLEDRTQNTITLLVDERGLDPKAAADYLCMMGGYTREEADRAVNIWLYSDNT